MQFVHIELELIDAVHVGAGRAGMVSRAQGFVPGHVLAYALAAVSGRRKGGKPDHFDAAVSEIRENVRCGPLFLVSPDGRYLYPRRDRERLAEHYFIGVSHNTLDGARRAAHRGGLFEVEAIARRPLHQSGKAPTRLGGGLWVTESKTGEIEELIHAVVLGGERNAGLGRVRLLSWQRKQNKEQYQYAGAGSIPPGSGARMSARMRKKKGLDSAPPSPPGIYMQQGALLPGPALDGVSGAPLQPWLGRLHDRNKGAGRRFSAPALVRFDGYVENDGWFEIETAERGFGCWKRSSDPSP